MARWRYDAQPLLRCAAMPEAPLYREIMEIFAEAAVGYGPGSVKVLGQVPPAPKLPEPFLHLGDAGYVLDGLTGARV